MVFHFSNQWHIYSVVAERDTVHQIIRHLHRKWFINNQTEHILVVDSFPAVVSDFI